MAQKPKEPTIDRSRRVLFDEVADLYDEVRPNYPETLIEDVIAFSGIQADGRILEIGCGPGKATIPFARRGYRMLAIELGEHLAALAAANCRPFPAVEIKHIAFEDWPVEENGFDLAISAEAFHWIPPEIGYPRLAQALKPGGSAALFWILRIDPETAVYQAISTMHQNLAPSLTPTEKVVTPAWQRQRITTNFAESGCFGNVTVRQYPWTEMVTGENFVKQLNTQSSYRNLTEPVRAKLFESIQEVIERAGGMVERPYLALLFQARVIGENGKVL
jgi:SAM-dependent methyltransferase